MQAEYATADAEADDPAARGVDDADPSLAVEAVATILAEPMTESVEELPPLLERQIDEALEEMESDTRP